MEASVVREEIPVKVIESWVLDVDNSDIMLAFYLDLDYRTSMQELLA